MGIAFEVPAVRETPRSMKVLANIVLLTEGWMMFNLIQKQIRVVRAFSEHDYNQSRHHLFFVLFAANKSLLTSALPNGGH
jgi:hypothetical protein